MVSQEQIQCDYALSRLCLLTGGGGVSLQSNQIACRKREIRQSSLGVTSASVSPGLGLVHRMGSRLLGDEDEAEALA